MIAIIGAMEVEINGLKGLLSECKVESIGGLEFFSGKIFNADVVVVKCGVGKVCAAAATAILLSRFNVSEVLNIGIAGGVGKIAKSNINVLNVVVASKVAQHDYDLTAIGYKLGQTQLGQPPYYECSERLANTLFNVAKRHSHCLKGTIVTGDKFIASDAEAKNLSSTFGAIACDMESAAIEQVCRQFNKEFVSLRTLSDSADNNAAFDFDSYEKAAAEVSIRIIKDYLAG